VPSAFAAMRQGGTPGPAQPGQRSVPTIVFHGDSDKTVHPVNSDQVMSQSREPMAPLNSETLTGTTPDGTAFTRVVESDGTGTAVLEQWTIHGGGHAWSGGDAAGSYTDAAGPDASREMVRFFLAHTNPAA
ncbi:MAG: esterase, partial [Alphaproteobacteria bacterium]|nr:esterase [Alphaproteobacteria bacterium]